MTKNNIKIQEVTENHQSKEDTATWRNQDNNDFYESVDVTGLQAIAVKGGIDKGCDVATLKPIWSKAKRILDAGSGYGRVIKALREQGYTGELTGIERNNAMFSYLHKHHHHHAELINSDLTSKPEAGSNFDAVLFMWSCLADFAQHEQLEIIKQLKSYLKPGGTLVIDTMPETVKPLDTEEIGNQTFTTKAKDSVVSTYEASYQEMCDYADKAGFKSVTLEKCTTDNSRMRWLYILV